METETPRSMSPFKATRWWTFPLAFVWALVQGNLWYSSFLFLSAATAVNGPQVTPGPVGFAMLLIVLQPLQLLAMMFLAVFVPLRAPSVGATMLRGLAFGTLVGAAIAAPPLGAAWIFYAKPIAAFLIPAGEQVVRLAGVGIIVALGQRAASAHRAKGAAARSASAQGDM